ncbi:hypothetical protein EAH78_31380 [Pseudomonas arsenicoxydans]|uniref:Uncharacterized protein n=1 Tax=Pseudomonas arsenicoxydans TaxID=702115 RepID=A0A502GX11_9PSED|nr:hypothetical protein EAH78_31380 [Pseudomonas arsenicoxydans]
MFSCSKSEQKQLNTWVSFESAEQPLLGQFSVSGNNQSEDRGSAPRAKSAISSRPGAAAGHRKMIASAYCAVGLLAQAVTSHPYPTCLGFRF